MGIIVRMIQMLLGEEIALIELAYDVNIIRVCLKGRLALWWGTVFSKMIQILVFSTESPQANLLGQSRSYKVNFLKRWSICYIGEIR